MNHLAASPAPKVDRVMVPGVLFFYEDQLKPNATTLRENVQAFCQHSKFPWYPVNLWFGFPPGLEHFEFAAVVFHYTLQPTGTWVTDALRAYVQGCDRTYKVAIFQDEFWYFRDRERILTDLRIDCLYSRHKPQHVRDVYGAHLPVREFHYYLAGYVSDDLIERANRQHRPQPTRTIDVGYRGRRLPYYLGRSSQEKAEIAEMFLARTKNRGLRLDVAVGETDRLYGESWDQFLANCRAMLGVEGGVSVIDLDGRFHREYERLIGERPNLTFAEFVAEMGPAFTQLEDRINYRSVTPRHFEAAAFRTLQILYEGQYEGILQPNVHYVPLMKDFSNLDDVLAVLADRTRVEEITNRAYTDLIASGRYSYREFVKSFDDRLVTACRAGPVSVELDRDLRTYLAEWSRFQSRVRDFDVVATKVFANDPLHNRRAVSTARELLADYRRNVDNRLPGEQSALANWLRHSADRGFWAQVERWLRTPIPVRREFDPDAGRRSPVERLATGPAAMWRMTRLYWARAVRKFRRALGRPTPG